MWRGEEGGQQDEKRMQTGKGEEHGSGGVSGYAEKENKESSESEKPLER